MKHRKLKIVAAIIVLFFIAYAISWQLNFSRKEEPIWGATFSQYYTEEMLGLDWQRIYTAVLNELNFKKLRLIAYWQYLETEEGKFSFNDLDWQIDEAQKNKKKVVLVIGYRVPRWPECHSPEWTKNLNREEWQKIFLNYLETIVNRYKKSEAVTAWQVENEPLLTVFGECPKTDINFLKEEIALIKTLDPTRPVIITESGELSFWFRAAPLGDILGTTLYRVVWNKVTGTWKHFYPPWIYTLRRFIAENFFKTENIIISELQAEPWAPRVGNLAKIDFEKQTKDFDINELEKNLEFAKRTGIREIYLWGVEWWYWRENHGDSSWVEAGKRVIK